MSRSKTWRCLRSLNGSCFFLLFHFILFYFILLLPFLITDRKLPPKDENKTTNQSKKLLGDYCYYMYLLVPRRHEHNCQSTTSSSARTINTIMINMPSQNKCKSNISIFENNV